MKREEIAETIKAGSTVGWRVSSIALLLSAVIQGFIWTGQTLKPLEQSSRRVGGMALMIAGFSLSGWGIARLLKTRIERSPTREEQDLANDEDERDRNWERLVEELWGTKYCVASCRGCKHLVGELVSGSYMVCAMHPYGQNNCLDWEER